jgi:hypothetical protein
MVVSNTKSTESIVPTASFAEIIKSAKSAKNIMTGETINEISDIKVPAMTALIIELK